MPAKQSGQLAPQSIYLHRAVDVPVIDIMSAILKYCLRVLIHRRSPSYPWQAHMTLMLNVRSDVLQRPLPWRIAETWLLQMIMAMADLNRQNLAHDDIKPVSLQASLPVPRSSKCTNSSPASPQGKTPLLNSHFAFALPSSSDPLAGLMAASVCVGFDP